MAKVRPLRIGISAHATRGLASGLGHYVRHLLTAWIRLRPWHHYHVFCAAADRAAFTVTDGRNVTMHVGGNWHLCALPDLLWHQTVLPLVAAQLRLDALFINVQRRFPLVASLPVVGTVHDLAAHALPGKYARDREFFNLQIMPALVRRQQHLISISEHTRADMAKYLGVRPTRVQVIANGVDAAPFAVVDRQRIAATLSRLGILTPYLVYPARLEHPGKNHVTAIAALAAANRRLEQRRRLVCIGTPWHNVEAIHAEVARQGNANDVVFTGYINESDKIDVLQGAEAMLFPSRYEGFGLPVLEGMAAGIPVVAARASSLPEVAGDAALWADPDDVSGFADAIIRLASDERLRHDLVQRGRERIGAFTWDACAMATLDRIERSVSA